MKKNVSTFKVAATYIGTVIGAGFASGQEILQFFSIFGNKGLCGLLITTLFFILFGYLILEIGYLLNSKSHLELTKFLGGKTIGTIIDYITTFFLFGCLTTMLAGTGAIFVQQFNLSALTGSLLMTLLTVATVLTGINGVINSISYVVPFLLTSAVGVSIVSLFKTGPDISVVAVTTVTTASLIRNWLWASILYVSYNTLTSVAVLSPLGAKAINRKSIRNGAVLGGLGLGLGAICIHFALFRHYNSIANLEVPMAFIAGSISYTMQITYTIVLIAEIYTTAVANLYGFSARIIDIENPSAKYVIIGSSLIAFFSSLFGFSNLVKHLYPLMGYAGVILLLCLLYTKLKLSYCRPNDR